MADKGGKLRRLYIPKKSRNETVKWLSDNDRATGYLFLNRFGEGIIARGISQQLKNYADKFYKLPENERLFPIVAEAIQHKLKRYCVKAGVKRIRLHSLRHSHTAYLIYQGVQPLIIKERLGHRDIKITLNTYGHLYPSQQKAVAELLNEKRTNEKCPS